MFLLRSCKKMGKKRKSMSNATSWHTTLKTFSALLQHILFISKQRIISRNIDAMFWVSTQVVASQYLLPLFGVQASFGTFIFAGLFSVWPLFEVVTQAGNFIADIHGNNKISYELTLPIPQWLIFLKFGLETVICSLLGSIVILPIGMLILGKHLSFEHTNWFYFIVMLLLTHMFYGAITIFMTSITPSVDYLTSIRSRYMFPLWFLGGYQTIWLAIYQKVPWVGCLLLLNPITYTMEGLRAALLGQEGYIPLWINIVALLFFSWFFAYLGIKILKRRLDCLP